MLRPGCRIFSKGGPGDVAAEFAGGLINGFQVQADGATLVVQCDGGAYEVSQLLAADFQEDGDLVVGEMRRQLTANIEVLPFAGVGIQAAERPAVFVPSGLRSDPESADSVGGLLLVIGFQNAQFAAFRSFAERSLIFDRKLVAACCGVVVGHDLISLCLLLGVGEKERRPWR